MKEPENFFAYKRVLITGASGFIGGHLIQRLQKSKAFISVVSRTNCFNPHINSTYCGDIRNAVFINECIKDYNPDYIFHLAAYKERSEDINSFYTAIETNLIGTLNLFSSAAGNRNLRSIVVIGTAEEYGNNDTPFREKLRELPATPYSFSKVCISHLSELFHKLYNFPVIVIRPTLAYGPGQGMEMFLPSLIRSLFAEEPFNMSPGEQTRDLLYVTDIVDALILSSSNPRANGEVINIGSGDPIKLVDLAHLVETMTGKKGLVKIGGKPYRKNEVMNYSVDIRKAEKILGWTPKTSLMKGLEKTISYYREVNGI